MSTSQPPIFQVLKMITHLGGPECSPEELQWAMDIPAGKQLLEWLASQVSDETQTNESSTEHRSRHINAALSSIALCQDELDVSASVSVGFSLIVLIVCACRLLTKAGARNGKQSASAVSLAPSSYELPSQLRYAFITHGLESRNSHRLLVGLENGHWMMRLTCSNDTRRV